MNGNENKIKKNDFIERERKGERRLRETERRTMGWREGKREGENLLFLLLKPHWWLLTCALTPDQRLNPQPWCIRMML